MRLQIGLDMRLYFVLFASVVLFGSQLFGAVENRKPENSSSSRALMVRPSSAGLKGESSMNWARFSFFTQPSVLRVFPSAAVLGNSNLSFRRGLSVGSNVKALTFDGYSRPNNQLKNASKENPMGLEEDNETRFSVENPENVDPLDDIGWSDSEDDASGILGGRSAAGNSSRRASAESSSDSVAVDWSGGDLPLDGKDDGCQEEFRGELRILKARTQVRSELRKSKGSIYSMMAPGQKEVFEHPKKDSDWDYEDKDGSENDQAQEGGPLLLTHVKPDALPQDDESCRLIVWYESEEKYDQEKKEVEENIGIEEQQLYDDMLAWRAAGMDQQNGSQWLKSRNDLILRFKGLVRFSEFRYLAKNKKGSVYFKDNCLYIDHPIRGLLLMNVDRIGEPVGEGDDSSESEDESYEFTVDYERKHGDETYRVSEFIGRDQQDLYNDMISWYENMDSVTAEESAQTGHGLISRFKYSDKGFEYNKTDKGIVHFKNNRLYIGRSRSVGDCVEIDVAWKSSVAANPGGQGEAGEEPDSKPQVRSKRFGSGFLRLGTAAVVGTLSYLAQKFSRGSGDSPVDGGNSSAGTSSQVGSDVNAAAPVLVQMQDGVADKVSDSSLDEALQQSQEALGEVEDLYLSKNSEAVEKALAQEGSFAARFMSDETLSAVKKTALGSVLAAGVLKLFHYCYSQYKKNSGLRGAKSKAQMWAEKAVYYAQQYKKMTMATAGGLAVVGFYLLHNR